MQTNQPAAYRTHFLFYIVLAAALILAWMLSGCTVSGNASAASSESSSKDSGRSGKKQDGPPRDNTPQVLEPAASGSVSYGNDLVTIDVSGSSQGYLILTYNGSNEKVKFQIQPPEGITCTYLVSGYGVPLVYPLVGGDGTYSATLYEAVDAENDKYAVTFAQSFDVALEDEFLPFLHPNVNVDFTADTAAVAKGASLAEDCYSDLDVINNIYHYVTEHIAYDEAKAQSVAYGYTPNIDDTLSSGKGICFDYASLMTCMLRTQRIPTRLEVGYVGELYHAWISCYVDEIGWVDDIIEFDGENWSLMDPTLAANNNRKSVQQYIGDGSNYTVKYIY